MFKFNVKNKQKELHNKIREYISAYVQNNNLTPLIGDISIVPLNEGYDITVSCAFPETLIGKKGMRVRELSGALSVFIDSKARINIQKSKV